MILATIIKTAFERFFSYIMPKFRRIIIGRPRNRIVVIERPSNTGGSGGQTGRTGQPVGLLWFITNP